MIIDPSVIKIIFNLRSQNMVGISTNAEEYTDKSFNYLTVLDRISEYDPKLIIS